MKTDLLTVIFTRWLFGLSDIELVLINTFYNRFG